MIAPPTTSWIGPRRRWHPTFVGLLSLFIALTFLLPARLVVKGPLGAAGRPSLLLGLGMLLVWMLLFLYPQPEARPSQPVRWIAGIYLTVWLATDALAYLRGLSTIEAAGIERNLMVCFSLVGTALVAADLVPDRRSIDVLLRRLTWAGAFMGFVGFLQFQFGYNLAERIKVPGLRYSSELIGLRTRGDAGLLRAAGTALHSIEFGVLSAVLFPIALHYALAATGRKARVRRWLVVVLCSVGVPFSLSRSGVLAITVGIFVLFRVWSRSTQRVALLALPLTVVALRVAIPGLVGTFVSFFVNAGNDNSIEGRTKDYELVGQLFAARPWFGLGAGTFRREEYTVLDNYFLTTLVSMGIVGVVAFTLVLTVPYAMAIRISRNATSAEDRHLATALAASLAGAMVATFTFDLLEFPSISGVVFLVIGLIGALHRTYRTSPRPPGPDVYARFVKDRRSMRPALFRRSIPIPEDVRRDAWCDEDAHSGVPTTHGVAKMSNARRRDAGSMTTARVEMD